ncbi:MAG: hypothetical protein K2I00_06195 [Ruminococcus sp.]|nr:hypothetical protein [Ruminococcus sp.]
MIEKKLKKSADKIRMSAELKERILNECGNEDVPEDVSENIGEQHIFTVEPEKSRTAFRIISSVACVAGISGIVLSGIFIGGGQFADIPNDESELTDTTEESEALLVSPDADKLTDRTEESEIMTDIPESATEEISSYTEEPENNIPFADSSGNIVFSGFRNIPPYNESTENLLDEEKSQNIRNILAGLEWEEIDVSEYSTAYYGNVDTMNFYAPDDERRCTLSINMDGSNTAMYSEAYIYLGDDTFRTIPPKYYRVDADKIFSGMTEYIYNFYNNYPPFGSIYKQTDKIYCSCDKYNGYISDENLQALSRAFIGWQWDNEEIVDVPMHEETGTQAFVTFTMDGMHNTDEYIVYPDGTVEWVERPWNNELSDYDSEIIHRYYDVDGEDDPNQPTGGLCLMLNRVITENVLGGSIVQKSW